MTTNTEHTQVREHQDQAAADIARRLIDYGQSLPQTRQAEHRAIIDTLDQATAAAHQARQDHNAAINNLDLHPDGRNARARQAREEGAKAVQEHHEAARARAKVLHASLTADALNPPPGQAEAALARQDAALILSLAEDKTQAMRDLATDPDTGVATLAAGPWGRRYLAAAGVPPERLDNTMELVRHSALQAIAERDANGTRGRAARAALNISALESAIGAHQTLTTQHLPREK